MTKKTVADIMAMKSVGEKITMLTAYDVNFARMIEDAGVDMVLVGDSLGMVILGYESTVPVTMEEMLHHCRAVRRGTKKTLLVGDMPFLSYQISAEDAVQNAGRFFKEAGCDAVKLEGGKTVCPQIAKISEAGMPVMGHIGLTPQSVGQLGGYKVQGRDLDAAEKLISDACALEEAGVFAVVLECIPSEVGAIISEKISIPTIGIGAGADCDGQVLVTHDLVGLFEKFTPKFVKQYVKVAPAINEALAGFVNEVRNGQFPQEEHSFFAGQDLYNSLVEKK